MARHLFQKTKNNMLLLDFYREMTNKLNFARFIQPLGALAFG